MSVLRLPRPSQQTLRRALAIARSKSFRIGLTVSLGLIGTAAAGLTIRHFVINGWPLAHADPWLVLAAGALFLGGYATKALGWNLHVTQTGAAPEKSEKGGR